MEIPDRPALRAALAALAPAAQKTAAGVIVLMMREPTRVRDREWLSEVFTRVAGRALGLAEKPSAAETEELRRFARRNHREVLNLCAALFVRVAEDLVSSGTPPASADLAQATRIALGYFAPGSSTGGAPQSAASPSD
jgi:hypothetical protein